jgi:hypothetical protein
MTDETLPEFLLARIAERKAAAWNAGPHEWRSDRVDVRRANGDLLAKASAGQYVAAHIATWDPAHVLTVCEVHRQIVELHAHHRFGHQCVAIDGPTQHHMADPCATLRLLGSLDADHPDYREEWK